MDFPKVDRSYSEADVENKILIPIIEEIGFKKEDFMMRVSVNFNRGREKVKKEADIVIYKNNSPFIVIEAKSPENKINDEVISQLDSYCFSLECKYGIASNGIDFIIRTYLGGNKKLIIINDKIKNLNIESIKEILTGDLIKEEKDIFPDLLENQTINFSKTLKQIHQDIRNIDKLDPTNAFDGWSKLLFMKIFEEKWTLKNGIVRFNYSKFLEQKEIQKAKSFIEETFKETKNAFPNIFENKNEDIGLSIDAIDKILERLNGVNILDVPYDVKGKAFEIFLSSTFRGKGLGQFFTPRPVVEFMTNLVDFKIDDVVLDPACGTGGFLIGAFHKIMENVNSTPKNYWDMIKTSKNDYIELLKKNNFFGIDAEPRATKTAKMNMIMWGDGENVFRGNGLDVNDKFGNPYPFQEEKIDVILANPPFGSTEKDDDILSNYELSNNTKLTECLFIEKALKYLKPKGKLAIVIPDSILGSDKLKSVRNLIRENSIIKGVFSLPKHTFTPSGVQTINSSVLFVEKFDTNFFIEKDNILKELIDEKTKKDKLNSLLKNYNDYFVFMGVIEDVGYDPTGKPTKSNINKTDLNIVLNNFYNFKEANKFDLSKKYLKIDNTSIIIHTSQLEDRLDSRYYWFFDLLESKKFKRVSLEDYIDIKDNKIDPKDFPEDLFSILSVTSKYGIILDEDDSKKFEVRGEDFTQKYKIVNTGDLAYNPYRINVGSIGIVEEEFNNKLVSPAYIVFKTKNGLSSKALIGLFKHSFYKLYIDILATGSIRNNFGEKYLKQIKIPEALITNSEIDIKKDYEEIKILNEKIFKQKEKLEKTVDKYLE